MNALTYQKIIKALTAFSIVIIITMPGEIIGLVFEFLHIIWELLVELLHIVFEWVEIALDTVIELLFETELHDTQIIVFYIIMSVIGYFAYRLLRRVPATYRRISKRIVSFWLLRKMRVLQYWYGLSVFDKIKVVTMSVGIACFMLFFSF